MKPSFFSQKLTRLPSSSYPGQIPNSASRIKNVLVVVAGYLFYGWWDWRFLPLIIFSTLVDYTVGRILRTEANQRRRKVLLWTRVVIGGSQLITPKKQQSIH